MKVFTQLVVKVVKYHMVLNILVFVSAIHAREQGSNKKTASLSCALSLVRQLFHMREIEPFTGETKKRKIESVSSIFEDR